MEATSLLSLSRPKEPLETDLLSIACSAALAGILLHVSIFQYTPLAIIARAGLIAASFNTGLVFSIAAYRLFFHRLRRFPGPAASKPTRFHDASLAARNLQYNVEIAKLHKTYGDFIRTVSCPFNIFMGTVADYPPAGPREICIVRKSAVSLIYGPQLKCLKSTWYNQAQKGLGPRFQYQRFVFRSPLPMAARLLTGIDEEALEIYQPRIKTTVDKFAAQIEKHLDSPLDASAWSIFLSFDIMGEVGFGKDVNNLTTGVEHPAIKGIHDHMHVLGVLSHVPWLLNMMGRIPGATAGYSGFFKWFLEQRSIHPRYCLLALKAFVEKDVSASSSEASLHEDSRVVIIAGRIKPITSIDDIIGETLRLRPALMTGEYRVTPRQGTQVDEVRIPGDVNVFVPVQVIQTDKRYYMEVREFVLERWGERREVMGTEGAPFMPFSLGPYNYPGKNLAMLSLRIATSTIAQQYNISFAPGETGEAFEKGALDTFTTTLPPVQVQFQRR
ncbi:hypothetical protein BBP40_003363 [Aspergillus hancockii]|nr:hypothetical protein BBP40_003363 [Aspergillus hancockii]